MGKLTWNKRLRLAGAVQPNDVTVIRYPREAPAAQKRRGKK